jgi:GT2 family glycosyltransferase
MTGSSRILAVVVTYESSAVLESCVAALRASSSHHQLEVRVVDNASRDGSAELATRLCGEANVIRLPENRGFAAGVNAGLAGAEQEWLAVINPDLVLAANALDPLVACGEREPRIGIAGPRVELHDGRREPTAGIFPTPAREWAHALLLDRVLGLPGRRARQPERTEDVDWLSGCAWLVRREAWRAYGPLDEGYFMYYEDVDFCRRLASGGWVASCCPASRAVHDRGTGSSGTSRIPADGGPAAIRYATQHFPAPKARSMRSALRTGWTIRRWAHGVRASLGDARSRGLSERYAAALTATE